MANGIDLTLLRRPIKKSRIVCAPEDVRSEFDRHPAGPFPGKVNVGMRLSIPAGRDYHAVPLNVWRQALQHFSLWRRPYVEDERDCDDYAKALWGLVHWDLGLNAAAYVRDNDSKHAYNVLLAVDGGKLRVHVYDPGWDRWYYPPHADGSYPPTDDPHHPMREGLITFGGGW